MAAPLVRGRALLRRRAAGVVFLVVIALLVELTIALYQKKFTPTVDVLLQADRIGNQLSKGADVKLRGMVVGEVRSVRSRGAGATLKLALDPKLVDQIPNNVRAQLLPKTLFGEKEVALFFPAKPAAGHLAAGDVITQDRSSTALETEQALNDLLPLLQSLQPQKLANTLSALATALRGRGDQLGANAATAAAYFRQLNPELPILAQDMAKLAELAQHYTETTPDLLRVLDNLAFSSRSLTEERQRFDTFLKTTSAFSGSAQTVLSDNERNLVDLARDSKPSLQLFAHYSGIYPCLLNRIAFAEIEGERVFGGAQPGLHITLELTRDQGGYAQGDQPQYKERRTFGCFGLDPTPVRPFPDYFNPQDGYRDSAPPESPGAGPRAWAAVASSTPDLVERRTSMPSGSTVMDALLLGGIA